MSDAIREHAHLAKFHHTKVRNAKKKLAEFRRELEAMGITVIIEDTKPQRRHSGNTAEDISP